MQGFPLLPDSNALVYRLSRQVSTIQVLYDGCRSPPRAYKILDLTVVLYGYPHNVRWGNLNLDTYHTRHRLQGVH